MNDFYDLTLLKRPSSGRKRLRYDKLPYDPALKSDSVGRLTVPKSWVIKPGNKAQDVAGSGALLSLLKERSNRKNATTAEKIQHLFSRASFGLTVAEFETYSLLTPEQAVDALLSETPLPDPPGDWVTEPFDFEEYRQLSPREQMAFLELNRERFEQTRMWWFELMMSSPFNLRERMTLFWHGLFTSDIEAATLAQIMFKQNDTWRQHALGNFRDFLKAMYKDPAMLLYLNGVQNFAEAPNENFARELLELFTMGVGNYTENDIKEAARAFTGWHIDTINWTSFLYTPGHDFGIKEFLGERGNFDGDDIIDIILEQEVTARYICRRLFEFFVSRELNDEFIDGLASTFRSNNYEIAPVLEQLFKSEFFYSDHTRGSLIKSPIDLNVGNARAFSVTDVNVFFLVYATAVLDQELFRPPNVAGWPGQRVWISPNTYVLRNTVSELYVNEDLFRDRDTGEPPVRFDTMAFARSFGIETARELTEAMTNHLLRIPVSDETLDFLVTVLLGTANPEDWSLNYPGAERLVEECLIQILRLPEFHLA